MMITLAVDNGRQGKVEQLGLECVVGVTLTHNLFHPSCNTLIYYVLNKRLINKQGKIVNVY
ncbi:hypothetical protein AYJ02_12130 [Shewanella algae]|nr:hypothetical protein AYJ02_12130 [Shewanella algae]